MRSSRKSITWSALPREEALNQKLLLGERSLYYVLQQYVAHYHHERNHQGLSNRLIAPEPGMRSHSGQGEASRALE
jgi:putative transposase